MSNNEKILFEQICKYCGFAIPVTKTEVKEGVICPNCSRPNLVGEGQPNVEEAVKEVSKEGKEPQSNF